MRGVSRGGAGVLWMRIKSSESQKLTNWMSKLGAILEPLHLCLWNVWEWEQEENEAGIGEHREQERACAEGTTAASPFAVYKSWIGFHAPRPPLLSLRPKTAIKITFQLSQWVMQEEETESLACWPSDTLLLLLPWPGTASPAPAAAACGNFSNLVAWEKWVKPERAPRKECKVLSLPFV